MVRAQWRNHGLTQTTLNLTNHGACRVVFHGEAVATAMGQSVGLPMTHTVVNRDVPHEFIHGLCHVSSHGWCPWVDT